MKKAIRSLEVMGRRVIFADAKNSVKHGISYASVSNLQNFKPGVALVPLFEFFAVLDTPGDFVSLLFKNREK